MGDIMAGLAGMQGGVTDVVKMLWSVFAQQKTWEREDNAVSRRVRDLQAAGLNPVLAAGSAAQASAPVSLGQAQGDSIMTAIAAHKMRQDAARTNAETQYLRQQAKGAEIVNETLAQERDTRIAGMNLDNALKAATMDSNIMRAAAAAAQGMSQAAVSSVEADIARLYGLMGAKLDVTLKEIEVSLDRTRLTETEKQIASLIVATDTAAYNLKWFKEKGLPVQQIGDMYKLLGAIVDKLPSKGSYFSQAEGEHAVKQRAKTGRPGHSGSW